MKYLVNQSVTYLGKEATVVTSKICIYTNKCIYSLKVKEQNGTTTKVYPVQESLINS